MRKLYDAVSPANIPSTAQMVAGYVDGRYAWTKAEWARFPLAVKVRIAVFSSTNDGHVLDVEPGCSTAASAPGWVLRRRKAGVDPTVYCNTATWPTVRAAFAAAKVAQPHYWIAAYPGIGPALYPGAVAHQYAGGITAPVDISVVADYWPGVDTPPLEPDMPITQADATLIMQTVLAAKLGRSETTVAQALQATTGLHNTDVAAIAAAVLAGLPAGTGGGITVEQLAKAVNDDAARRLVS